MEIPDQHQSQNHTHTSETCESSDSESVYKELGEHMKVLHAGIHQLTELVHIRSTKLRTLCNKQDIKWEKRFDDLQLQLQPSQSQILEQEQGTTPTQRKREIGTMKAETEKLKGQLDELQRWRWHSSEEEGQHEIIPEDLNQNQSQNQSQLRIVDQLTVVATLARVKHDLKKGGWLFSNSEQMEL